MDRFKIASLTFVVLLPLSGCTSAPPPQPPTKATTVVPVSPPTQSVSEAEQYRREVDELRRKSKSGNLIKKDAYRKYIP